MEAHVFYALNEIFNVPPVFMSVADFFITDVYKYTERVKKYVNFMQSASTNFFQKSQTPPFAKTVVMRWLYFTP